MKLMPSFDRMYRAMVERDTTFDGAFFAGVRTTGIFCRPGCGAKKPKRENVDFFESSSEALRAGFRPCRRCHPLALAGATPDWARTVFELVERNGQRVTASELRAAGVHPARAARWFKKSFGVTFQAYARARRVGAALQPLRNGADVGTAAEHSGFESESGFRAAFERLFGAPPKRLSPDATTLLAARLATPIGPMLAIANDAGVCLLEFVDRRSLERQIATLRRRFQGVVVPGDNAHLRALRVELADWFKGVRKKFDVPLVAPGTPFQERVWAQLARIPFGETRSYAEVARAIGEPKAVRAVARANGDNRLALLIPCHRVIGSNGEPTGYAGGLWRKRWLLEHERR
jgi:AraC family transcriptional regulator of adaptative response/methylated-DNA-[protein]-cysteine methyltransferase